MPISAGPGQFGANHPATTGFADIAGYSGVDPTGVSECASAINTALAAIAAAGQRAYARGTFKIASTVTITDSADLGDATFNYTGTSGTAVRIGTSTSGAAIEHISVVAPRVVATAKTVTGWAQVAGTIGLDIANLYSSFVTVPYVSSFETGLRVYGAGTGCVYNQIAIGHLHNSKICQLLDASSTGWANENVFTVGRYSQESAEGSDVSGARIIKAAVTTNPISNNLWIKPCLEGDVAEFHIEMGGGENRILQGRFEATTPKVQWQSNAFDNVIDGGYESGNIVQTIVSGALRNNIWGHLRHYHTRSGGSSGIAVLENVSSSGYPADVVMDPGAQAAASSPATAYRVARGADYTHMKRAADAQPRITLDHTNGRIYLGDGTNAADAYLRGGQTYLAPIGHVLFLVDNTHDIGSGSYRPRDVFVGRDLEIDGALNHDGSTVGFYGATPVAKQTGVAVSAAGIHAALVNLGLIGA